MRDASQLLVACVFGSVTKDEIDGFVDSVTQGDEEYDPLIFDAYRPDHRIARSNLELYLRKSNPEFDMGSDEGVIACRRELKYQIERLGRNECSQEEFCVFFRQLESELVVNKEICANFMGDLYNACDCFDKDWKFLPNEYLEEESKRVLETIIRAEEEGDSRGD